MSEEVTKIYLKRIELLNKKLHSYIYIDYEGAIKSASAIDNLISSGVDLGPLMGTPIAIKDICAVSGMPTTNGSIVKSDDWVRGDLSKKDLKKLGLYNFR